jgi:hypothetical protein
MTVTWTGIFARRRRLAIVFEKAESTREKRQKSKRHIKLPGKPATYANTDPIEIARELRSKSKLGQREARLDAAEKKRAR